MTMACIKTAFELFKTNTCAASAIAVAAFVLGAVAACVACRLFGPCCGKGAAKGGKCAKDAQKPVKKVHAPPADGSIEIYVGNLSYEMTEEQLRKEFEAYGKVNVVRIVSNRYNNKSKGFGFVQMPDRAEAEAAIAALNDKDIMGRKLKCNEARNS